MNVIFNSTKDLYIQDVREANSPSFYNPEEIIRVISYVEELIAFGVDEDDIGVITPYRTVVSQSISKIFI